MPKPTASPCSIGPRILLGAALIAGSAAIAALVVAAGRPQIRKHVLMRQVRFDQSLRHHDTALRALDSLHAAMFRDPTWQKCMLQSLQALGQSKRIAALAADLNGRNCASPDLLWNGWKALLKDGDDARAEPLFTSMLRPGTIKQLGETRGALLSAWRSYRDGQQDKALASLDKAAKLGIQDPLLTCLRADSRLEQGDVASARKALLGLGQENLRMARAKLCHGAILLGKGEIPKAQESLDRALRLGAIVGPTRDALLDRIAKSLDDKFQANARAMLAQWREERSKTNAAVSASPFPTSLAQLPALPSGEVVFRAPPAGMVDLWLKPESYDRPLAPGPHFLTTATLEEPGFYALVIRGAANRSDSVGVACTALVTDKTSQTWAGTYFSSPTPADRRVVLSLRAGPVDIGVGCDIEQVESEKHRGPRLWLGEVLLVKLDGPHEEINKGEFSLVVKPR